MQVQYSPNQQYQPQQYPQQQYQQFPSNQQVVQPIVIMQQQVQLEGPQHFKNPLCGCMKNCPICMVSCLCCCVLSYNHAQAISKATKGITSCCLACFLDWIGCCCFNRQALRRAYNIDGSICEDCCIMMLCGFCAMMQDVYEAEERG